jgi:hypothetical protein
LLAPLWRTRTRRGIARQTGARSHKALPARRNLESNASMRAHVKRSCAASHANMHLVG